ncbi:MAG: hypothetical protein V4492_09350 [Chlamydiota bacterium]
MWKYCAIFLLFSGCAPSTLSDFRHEGESRCREILIVLEQIEDREQLLRSEPALKKHFETLITLMIEARKYQESHPEDALTESEYSLVVESELQEELRRIYQIEGGREVVERTQHEALVRLDAFERELSRKKGYYKRQN